MADLIRRSLDAAEAGEIRALQGLRWQAPLGTSLRIWFARGTPAEALKLAPGPVRLRQGIRAGETLIVSGECDRFDGPLTLDFDGGTLTLVAPEPEPALLEGLRVLCGQRVNETALSVADWLSYHAAVHGAEAAVILDRTAPGAEQNAFADDLATLAADIDGLRRVVLVNCPLPLGVPGAPALGDPLAPPSRKAQGAQPDPWRAPLAEPLVYDILKWRFLTRAAAVAAADVCDLISAPMECPGVFDTVLQSHGGYLSMAGEAVYPWRIRKGRAPAFGDHICRSDPPMKVANRWAVVPARCGPEALWTPTGIPGMMAEASDTAQFHRHMALVYPQSPVKDLIKKAYLIEDARLTQRAKTRLGANPIPPPPAPADARASAPPVETGANDRVTVVTCMKNEAPFILEWLVYHRMIGVGEFLVYTNDCADGTDRLLDILQDRGLVQRRDNPFRDMDLRPQHAALACAPSEPLVAHAGWILPIDVDEFVNIHAGEGHLRDLFAAVPTAQAISMTWRLFGSSDRDRYEDSPVTAQFTRCAPHLTRRPHQAWGFKTLFQNSGIFAELGVHRPKGVARGVEVNWVNGSGKPMPRGILRTGWRSGLDSYGYDLVTLNHYAVRNAESFLVKRDRGRVNHVSRDQGEAYWFRMNNNAEEDRSIQRTLPGLEAGMADLLVDREIAEAHNAGVAWHQDRIARLLADQSYRGLYESLTSSRMKRLSRLHRHFGMNVFLNGPGVIPDHLIAGDIPANFFFNTAPPPGAAAD